MVIIFLTYSSSPRRVLYSLSFETVKFKYKIFNFEKLYDHKHTLIKIQIWHRINFIYLQFLQYNDKYARIIGYKISILKIYKENFPE